MIKKITKYFFALLLGLTFLTGCKTSQGNESGGASINIKTAEKRNVEGVGDTFFLTVRNSQLVVKFNDYVEVSPTASWTLSYDIQGNNTIASKTVPVEVGHPASNLLYIYVSNNNEHETYPVLVHRNYMFTVSFNSNGGTACESQEVEEGYYLEEELIPTTKKTGYTFTGWDYDFSLPITSNVTANAVFESNRYQIHYNVDEGELVNEYQSVLFGQHYQLMTPYKRGYNFVCWVDKDNNVFASEGTYSVASNIELYAKYEIIEYRINYVLNGGTNDKNNPSTYTVEDDIYLSLASMSGYNFIGWAKDMNGDNAEGNYHIERGSIGELTLYAIFEANKNTLGVYTSNPLRGSVELVSGEGYSDETITIKTTANKGYYLSKIVDNEGKVLAEKEPSEQSSNKFTVSITKPAAWSYLYIYLWNNAGTYKVSWPGEKVLPDSSDIYRYTFDTSLYSYFILNSGDGNQTEDTLISSIKEYTNIYVDGNKVKGISDEILAISSDEFSFTMPRHDYSVYAVFEPITYRINYVLAYGNHSNPETYNIEQQITLNDAYRAGYTFLGWFDRVGNKIEKISQGTTGDITLYGEYNYGNNYVIHLDPNGGSLDSDVVEVQYDHQYQLPIPTRLGYEFVYWYNGLGKEYPLSGTYTLASDSYLTAKWQIINYEIRYNLDGGKNNSSNPTSYTVNDEITLSDPTKTGYTFLGWSRSEYGLVTSIPKGTTGIIELTATWNNGNEYVLTLDYNGGSEGVTTMDVHYDGKYTLPTPARSGYNFLGWYYAGSKIDNDFTWKYLSNRTFIAKWEIITYSITYILDGGTNSFSNPETYNVTTSRDLANPTKVGYTFLGWVNESTNEPISKIEEGTTGDLILKAYWSPNNYNLVVNSDNENKGTVEIVIGEGTMDQTITVKAIPKENNVFIAWLDGNVKVSEQEEYTFIMPARDLTLTAHFLSNEEYEQLKVNLGITPVVDTSKKSVTFGLYPKDNINDSATLDVLNSLTDASIDSRNGWYYLNDEYYAKAVGKQQGNTTKYDNGVVGLAGKTYWFKCVPLTWKILTVDASSNYFLLSKYLIDSQAFYHSQDSRKIDSKTIYANNYEYSDMRAWLNNEFYNTAFALNDSGIQTTFVDNSAATTKSDTNPYCCNNTYDKVFLPSYKDYTNTDYGFDASSGVTNAARKGRTTDYSRCMGTNYSRNDNYLYYGDYCSRTPHASYSYYTIDIQCSGYMQHIYPVTSSSYGVRPAITFNYVL